MPSSKRQPNTDPDQKPSARHLGRSRLSRHRGSWLKLAGRSLAGGLIGLAGLFFILDRIFPPDLTRFEQRSALVLDREDRLLRAFTSQDGFWRLETRPDEVAPIYLKLLKNYEDRRFDHHPGVDPLALMRATGQWIGSGHIVSGGSTLTMQTARLLEPRPRTLGSKLLEILRALQLEARYSKDEVLTIYLTLAPFGGNLEGVRAASLAWFGKEPLHLTPAEAALLVVLPQSPTAWRPDRHASAAELARNKVLDRAGEAGLLSPDVLEELKAEAVPNKRFPLPFLAPHLAREALNRYSRAENGRDQDQRRGNREIRTMIDRDLQGSLEQNLRHLLPGQPPGTGIAAIVIENEAARVRALVGAPDFFDSRRFGAIDMTRAIRSPGSALKPFIYGMGFDSGFLHPQTLIQDAATLFETYLPGNFDLRHHGSVTADMALRHSLNIPAVAVLDRVGPARFFSTLEVLGLQPKLSRPDQPPGLPIALGGLGLNLRQLSSLYVALANKGRFQPLQIFRDTPGPEQNPPTPASQDDETPFLSDVAAWYVSGILRTVPRPPGFSPPGSGRLAPIAYKTGTSYGFRDAWAVGYRGRYTVGVWVGRPDGSPNPGHHGHNTAAPVLFRIFAQLPEETVPLDEDIPERALIARNHELPDGLKRLRLPGLPDPDRGTDLPLAILFPREGSRLELVARDGSIRPLPLKARGGEPPLRWLVNGVPLPLHGAAARDGGNMQFWHPDGRGNVSLTVIDAGGNSRNTAIWID